MEEQLKQVSKEDVNEHIEEHKGDTERYDAQEACMPTHSTAEFEGDLLDEWREVSGRANSSLSSTEDTRVYQKSGTDLGTAFEEQYA